MILVNPSQISNLLDFGNILLQSRKNSQLYKENNYCFNLPPTPYHTSIITEPLDAAFM